ncbi:MAG: hypothetical protein DLM61_08365 [Pseudonocardiales bacterium]|nr:MAG: hypothetical protein DLM61_08365 [Pseudonocardiales bacterium]
MRRNRTIIQALIGATILAGGLTALTPAAQASTPVGCSEGELVAAINLANASGGDTLALAPGCIYRMTSAHGGGASDALPVITSRVELLGPATITRASGSRFRIAEVSATGNFTLTTEVKLTNGSANGDGGAILNHGAVTLTNSRLSGNTATGNGGGLANADTPSGTAPAATFTTGPTFTGDAVSNNTAGSRGGGIYNGLNDTLTTTGVSGTNTQLRITGNTAGNALSLSGGKGGGIAAVNSTKTTLTETTVTTNHALGLFGTAGGVYRLNGIMVTTNSPITANTPNNCVGSVPAVPNCTG